MVVLVVVVLVVEIAPAFGPLAGSRSPPLNIKGCANFYKKLSLCLYNNPTATAQFPFTFLDLVIKHIVGVSVIEIYRNVLQYENLFGKLTKLRLVGKAAGAAAIKGGPIVSPLLPV